MKTPSRVDLMINPHTDLLPTLLSLTQAPCLYLKEKSMGLLGPWTTLWSAWDSVGVHIHKKSKMTSDKEVRFSVQFICLFVCLFVCLSLCRITQKLPVPFSRHTMERPTKEEPLQPTNWNSDTSNNMIRLQNYEEPLHFDASVTHVSLTNLVSLLLMLRNTAFGLGVRWSALSLYF